LIGFESNLEHINFVFRAKLRRDVRNKRPQIRTDITQLLTVQAYIDLWLLSSTKQYYISFDVSGLPSSNIM